MEENRGTTITIIESLDVERQEAFDSTIEIIEQLFDDKSDHKAIIVGDAANVIAGKPIINDGMLVIMLMVEPMSDSDTSKLRDSISQFGGTDIGETQIGSVNVKRYYFCRGITDLVICRCLDDADFGRLSMYDGDFTKLTENLQSLYVDGMTIL